MGHLHGINRRAYFTVNRGGRDAVSSGARRPWPLALGWLLFLAPFFYVTYGAANLAAAHRGHVASIVFDWERRIPFIASTIVPYWSIDAFYGLSLFVCATRRELGIHVRRLIAAQVVAVACFILFPLRFSFGQPRADGV